MKISIEGNIGSGKSSLLTRICNELRLPVFLEPVDEWKDWLSLFYTDPNRWGFSFNVKVLMSFNKWKDNKFKALYERSPISNRYVFGALQYENKRMSDLELSLFDEIYENLAWSPDVVIYVRTDPNVCMERIKKRGRECEQQVPLEYIQAVHNKHDEVFITQRNNNIKTFIVDGNKSTDEVFEEVRSILACQ